ncbi:PREDICTED: leucine-rich repeat-containing protein 2 [Apaloderma vittatum]|uniref:Leucine-rich repeat-containing protein 2 n=1 Tax=Apaloderma vittatum TaxID=57397 RepID=A0A091MYA4_APAVI|nr:PREDICTED: leucine-rich repeat-containing protein 2 [Apaloderma vittatum]KFP82498.1 Leucine-rich repeat-containing protein 2 [Apaloderma vittatum]
MGHQVIIFDFSLIRGLWETRVKRSKERQRKEKERLEKSSLEKIKQFQEWNFILECRKKGIPQSKYLKNGFVDTDEKILDAYGKTPQRQKRHALSDEVNKEESKFVLKLSGEQWTEFPDSLKEQIYLKEWHVYNTLIQTIPTYIALFQDLRVLELSKNQISHLPVEIGCLKNLKVLNVSFNNLKSVPPELGDCENLEKLDLSGNMEITELPFELSNLKQVTVVDVSANKFHSIPICVLRMSNLQWLDISSNNLKDLPEDIDRLDQLQTLLLQKNKLTYLPRALVNMPKLSLLVVSGDDLVEIPTAVCESTTGLKFISLKDSPVETIVCKDTEEIIESEREREQSEKDFMKAYIEDLKERDSTPSYTTKVLLSLQL